MDEIETADTTASLDSGLHTNDSDVPSAVNDAFNDLFPSDFAGEESSENTAASRSIKDDEQQQRDELEQSGVVTLDGNDASEEKTVLPESSEEAEPSEDAEGDEKSETATDAEGQKPPGLDPFLRFVAMNNGLNAGQIDKLYAADPETAVATLTALSGSFANLSRQYLGQPGSPVAPATQATETPASQSPTPGLDTFMSKLAAFTEANGEDLGQFAKLVNDEIVGPMKALQAELRVREQGMVRDEALAGFEAVREQFKDFYGPKDGTLTPGQQQARSTVANLADQIRAGAKAQGKQVGIKDALAKAHAIVTYDMQQQAARQQIVTQVQKRAKSATQPPTQRRTKPVGKRSDSAAQDAYRQKAMELGLDQF